MLIPWTTLSTVDERIGLGVHADRPIPAGTLIWVEDALDIRIPAQTVRDLRGPMRDAVYHAAYRPQGADYYLLCWDGAKYFNHSCEPNCLSLSPAIEIAVRDIAAGEQLTNDYAYFGLEPWERFDCRCGARACAGTLNLMPDAASARQHQRLIDCARRRASRVEQPLAPLLGPELRRLVEADTPQRTGRSRPTARQAVLEPRP
jgi:hypothetical protein